MNPYAIAGNLNKLSPEDFVLADAQKMCPVCDNPLALKGVPIKVDVDGQPVLICCEDCRAPLLENKEAHLAKLNKKPTGDEKKRGINEADGRTNEPEAKPDDASKSGEPPQTGSKNKGEPAEKPADAKDKPAAEKDTPAAESDKPASP